MPRILAALVVAGLVLLAGSPSPAWADEYADTIDTFKRAGESARFFDACYGYAVFPTIGKGGLGVGAAHGQGEFTSGNFEFGAGVSAVAVTASASAAAGSTGSSAGASVRQKNARTRGAYYRGMAVFTVARGGLMYEASVAGQKFSYRALAHPPAR